MLSHTNFEIYLRENAGLTDDEIDLLPFTPKSKVFSKGSHILDGGQICKDIFFVERGLLRQFSIDEEGKEYILHFAPEKWIVSNRNSAYFDEPGEYFIEAIEDTEVVVMDEAFINAASQLSKTFRENNHRTLHNHVRHLQKRISQLLGASAEHRYLYFLKLYPNLALRVPQWMIASYLGITPESLSRVRKELMKR